MNTRAASLQAVDDAKLRRIVVTEQPDTYLTAVGRHMLQAYEHPPVSLAGHGRTEPFTIGELPAAFAEAHEDEDAERFDGLS